MISIVNKPIMKSLTVNEKDHNDSSKESQITHESGIKSYISYDSSTLSIGLEEKIGNSKLISGQFVSSGMEVQIGCKACINYRQIRSILDDEILVTKCDQFYSLNKAKQMKLCLIEYTAQKSFFGIEIKCSVKNEIATNYDFYFTDNDAISDNRPMKVFYGLNDFISKKNFISKVEPILIKLNNLWSLDEENLPKGLGLTQVKELGHILNQICSHKDDQAFVIEIARSAIGILDDWLHEIDLKDYYDQI